MQAILDFLVNNYLWFLIISLILIFALIGYLVDTSEQSNDLPKMKEAPDVSASAVSMNVEVLGDTEEVLSDNDITNIS